MIHRRETGAFLPTAGSAIRPPSQLLPWSLTQPAGDHGKRDPQDPHQGRLRSQSLTSTRCRLPEVARPKSSSARAKQSASPREMPQSPTAPRSALTILLASSPKSPNVRAPKLQPQQDPEKRRTIRKPPAAPFSPTLPSPEGQRAATSPFPMLLSPSGAGGQIPIGDEMPFSLLSPPYSASSHARLSRKIKSKEEDDSKSRVTKGAHFGCLAASVLALCSAIAVINAVVSYAFPYCDLPVGCFHLESELRASMVVGVDPCQDMHGHVCGRWAGMYPSHPDQFDLLNDRLRMAFVENIDAASEPNSAADRSGMAIATCMGVAENQADHTGVIREVFKRRGFEWPARKTRSNRDMFRLLVALTMHDQLGVLFQLVLAPYVKVEGRYAFELTRSYTMLSHSLDSSAVARCVRAFGSDVQDVDHLAEEIVGVEGDVQTSKAIHLADESPIMYIKFGSIDERREHVPELRSEWWIEAINENLPEGSSVDEDTDLLLKGGMVLDVTEDIMKQYRRKSLLLQNYIGWKILRYLSYAASSEMSSCQFKQGKPYWTVTFVKSFDRCSGYVRKVLPYGVLKLQVKGILTEDSVWYTANMTHQIRYQMELSYNRTSPDATSATELVKRLRAIHEIIGTAAKLRTDAALDAYYKHIPAISANSFALWFVESLRSAAAHKKRFLKPPSVTSVKISRDDWDFAPIYATAIYVHVYHIIFLPGSILLPPFLAFPAPDSFNYGSIGKVIGHELMHAFDREQLDIVFRGETRDMYTTRFRKQYTGKLDCLVLQANKYAHSAIVGNNSISETLCDNAGLEAAFQAYQALPGSRRQSGVSGLTADQAFFAASCYSFCRSKQDSFSETNNYLPYKLRCNQPCLNMEGFADAFSCPKGSPLNPLNQCRFFGPA